VQGCGRCGVTLTTGQSCVEKDNRWESITPKDSCITVAPEPGKRLP